MCYYPRRTRKNYLPKLSFKAQYFFVLFHFASASVSFGQGPQIKAASVIIHSFECSHVISQPQTAYPTAHCSFELKVGSKEGVRIKIIQKKKQKALSRQA
mmetsp:Transcript_5405/g.6616  ORF Transcript_5405/g.6616 Transcript_5405/m.6616 type:complete len:100 (-) Transcript_5405:118-417(-)